MNRTLHCPDRIECSVAHRGELHQPSAHRLQGRAVASALVLTALVGMSALPCAAQSATPPVQPLSCVNNARAATPYGDVLNNMWNKKAAGPGAWRQCLQVRTNAQGNQEWGWTWKWPRKDNLYAYPQVMVGVSPWRAEANNDARFPIRIDRLRRLLIEHDVSITSDGKQNLATDLWITRQAPVVGKPDPANIRAELMIWTHASPGLIDASSKPLATFDLAGQTWTLYSRPATHKLDNGKEVGWTYIAYIAKNEMLKGKLDVRALVLDAVARGLISAQDHVAGFEWGNEIISGSGSTWVKQFALTVE